MKTTRLQRSPRNVACLSLTAIALFVSFAGSRCGDFLPLYGTETWGQESAGGTETWLWVEPGDGSVRLDCQSETSTWTPDLCEIADAGCRKDVLKRTARILGEPPLDSLRFETLTRDEYAARLLVASFADSQLADRLDGEALYRFGFLRARPDSAHAEASAALVANVAAYYEYASDTIYIVSAGAADMGWAGAEEEAKVLRDDMATLAHEIVHAYQHRAFGLDAVREVCAGDPDCRVAVTSATEGQAELVRVLYDAELHYGRSLTGADLSAWLPTVHDDWFAHVTPNEGEPPSHAGALRAFPYFCGLMLAASRYAEAGGDMAAVSDLLADPPTDTAWVIDQVEARLGYGSDEPLCEGRGCREASNPCPIPDELAADLGLLFYDADVLGGADLALLVAEEYGAPQMHDIARAWTGGELQVFFAGLPGADWQPVFVLRTAWHDEAAAERAAIALQQKYGPKEWKAQDPQGSRDIAEVRQSGRCVSLVQSVEAGLVDTLLGRLP